MKIRLIKLFTAICVLAFTFDSFSQNSPQASVVEVKSNDVIRTRSGNPNILVKAPSDDTNPIPIPAKKTGTTDSKEFDVSFENNTGYFVEIYVDGIFKGTIPGWASITIPSKAGYSKIYCITTGGTKDWYANGNFEGNYVWKLK